MLKTRTQLTTIHKVKAHTNIEGNEQADQLANRAPKKDIDSQSSHTNLHTLHHITSKKTRGHDQIKDRTKAMSDA